MNRLVDLEARQMDLTIQQKPYFDKIHCSGTCSFSYFTWEMQSPTDIPPGFVRRHLEKSEGQGSCLDMAKVIIERSAPDLLPELQVLQWTEYNKFHEMLAYYSGAVGGEEKVGDKRE